MWRQGVVGLAALVFVAGVACNSSDSSQKKLDRPVGTEPGSSCTDKATTTADVDGDGRRDRVFWGFIEEEGARLTVCTASGDVGVIHARGMSELLFIGDIEPDGREEIFYGGTTVNAGFVSIAVVIDDRLREVVLEDGSPLTLVDGLVFDDQGFDHDSAWGCEHTDGDGDREVVQATIEPEGGALRWTREVYRLRGATATRISTETGTMSEPVDGPAGTAASLTSPCELQEPV